MAVYFDRYDKFKSNGLIAPMPFIPINPVATDKSRVYKKGETRLDILSQEYYNNPYHGFLIMSANPQYGGMEFDIKNRDVIRIPFPFESAIERYLAEVDKYLILYG